MAVRKTNTKRTQAPARKPQEKTTGRAERVPGSVIFWLFLFIVLITAFFALLPRVMKGINLSPKQTVTERPAEKKPSEQTPPAKPPTPEKKQEQPSAAKPPAGKPSAPKTPDAQTKQTAPQESPEKPAEQKPSQPITQPPIPLPPPAPSQQPPLPDKAPEAEKPAETRDAGIYFLQEKNGSVELTLVKVSRRIKNSASPLQDSINALLSGPTAEEKNRGIINLIPAESRMISSLIRGNTAYLDFNEEFRYNTLGREGSVAQIRQIVWTATEFPNVRDVQFLIEGRPVDFLSEGVMIGSPIGR